MLILRLFFSISPTTSDRPHHLVLVGSQAQPARSALPLYPRDVLLADGVPGAHVLLHAALEAALLAARQRSAGLGDAALEAVFVEFLELSISIGDAIERIWQGWRIGRDEEVPRLACARSAWRLPAAPGA